MISDLVVLVFFAVTYLLSTLQVRVLAIGQLVPSLHSASDVPAGLCNDRTIREYIKPSNTRTHEKARKISARGGGGGRREILMLCIP